MKISKSVLQAILAGVTVGAAAIIYYNPVEKEVPAAVAPESTPEEPRTPAPDLGKVEKTRDSLINISDPCPPCGKG